MIKSPFKYSCRPGYGSKDLLIDFHNPSDQKLLVQEVLNVIEELKPVNNDFKDLWMNDEFVYIIKTDLGQMEFSIDSWGCAFILAENNNELINTIDKILNQNSMFEKIEVDFNEYK